MRHAVQKVDKLLTHQESLVEGPGQERLSSRGLQTRLCRSELDDARSRQASGIGLAQ